MGAVLLERGTELAAVTRLVDSAASGTGAIAVIAGEPGCGKSALVDALAPPARRRRVRLVVVQADTGGALDEAVVAVEAHVAHPTVVAIEDLHDADKAGLAAVRALARRVAQVGCGLVVTARPGGTSAAQACVDELLAAGGQLLRPAPLSAEAVAHLVDVETGGPPGPCLARRLAGAAGNPLLVQGFLRAARDIGALVRADGCVELDESEDERRVELPPRIVSRLTTALTDAAQEVLHVAAVVGPCAADWLGPLVESPPAVVRKVVCEATTAGLLDPTSTMVQFRHELLRDALAARVAAAARAAIHRQVGRQLAAAGAAPALVARHLELGSPSPDSETVRWMRRAAADAAVLDPGAAAELLRRAVAAMSIDAPDRGPVLAQLARCLLSLARPAEARSCAGEALAHATDPGTRAELQSLLAQAALLEGRSGDAVAEIERALAACEGDRLQTARLRARSAVVRLWAYDLERAVADAEAAAELGAAIGDPVATSRALSVSSRVAAFQLDLPRAVWAGEQAVRRAGDVPAAIRGAPHLYLGLALLNADQFDRARQILNEGAARCEEIGAVWALPRYQGALAVLSFFVGAWDEAMAASESGAGFAHETGCREGQAQIDAVAGLIAHHRGDDTGAAAAERRAASATAEPGADQAAVPYLLWLKALRAAARGDLTRAVARLDRACKVAIQLRVPLVALWLAPDLARLAMADGQRELAEWIAGEIERVAPAAQSRTADAVARFCRAVVSHDAEALLAAADGFEAAGRPLFAARALDAAGELAERAGRRAAAVDALRRAAGIYERVGAALDGRATARELRALGARSGARGARRRPVAGWSSLTPTEQTVAGLVAEGLANGEIAARLYVSKRTVETHISRLYVKLQVDSRVAIANLGRRAAEPAPT